MEHSKTIKPTILVLIMPVAGAHGHVYFPIKITYAITLKGAGFNILWESILGLSVLGGFFSLSVSGAFENNYNNEIEYI